MTPFPTAPSQLTSHPHPMDARLAGNHTPTPHLMRRSSALLRRPLLLLRRAVCNPQLLLQAGRLCLGSGCLQLQVPYSCRPLLTHSPQLFLLGRGQGEHGCSSAE